MSPIDQLKSVLDLFRTIGLEPARPHREPRDRLPGSRQVAAVVLRQKRKHREVLLITSRDTGRWIVPKGWVESDENAREAAEREAWEEAGVRGKAIGEPLGSFEYVKIRPQRGDVVCRVDVYHLELQQAKSRWPEMRERKRKWVKMSDALKTIDEPGLVQVLADSPLFRRAA